MPELPPRDPAAEDAWIQGLADASPEALIAAVRAAVEARRPVLAARVVGLLDPDAAADDPAVARARRAAELLCLPGADHVAARAELDEVLALLRARRMRRIKARHRRRLGLRGVLARRGRKRR